MTLDGKNVFKNNDNNSILARGEVTFADGSHTILSGGSTQGIAGYDTSVFTIEKGSVVDALDGVYVLGTVDNSGQLTLGAGEYDYSVINTLDGTDGTIIIDADLVVSAIGKPKYFDKFDFNGVGIVVDVGINRDENGKLCGDVNSEGFFNSLPNTYLTPVPNGVGKLTTISLMKNVIEAYELQNEK